MAKWQKVYLHRKTLGTGVSNTVTVDLPEKDYLSQIMVKMFKTNPAYSTPLMPIFHFVRRLEVVDGSDVLFSLTGAQTQAISYYRGRTNPCAARNDWPSEETYDYFYIRFNRFPGDTKYLLNLSLLANPQLKITWSTTPALTEGITYTVQTVGATLAPYYTVVCDVLRGTPPGNYIGKFISSKEFYTWNQAVAAMTEYVDVPRTDPIFGIGLRSAYTAKTMDTHFNRVKLNINNQEWIPFDIYADEMRALHEEWFSPKCMIEERIESYRNIRYDSGCGDAPAYMMENKWSNQTTQRIQSDLGGWLRPDIYDGFGGAHSTDNLPIWYHFIGLFPQHMLYLPMSVITDTPEEVLDAPATANILLEVTSAASAAAVTSQAVIDIVRNEGR